MRSKRSSEARIKAALMRIRLTDEERRVAEDSLAKGELITDLVIGAATMVSRTIQRFRRGLRSRRTSGRPAARHGRTIARSH